MGHCKEPNQTRRPINSQPLVQVLCIERESRAEQRAQERVCSERRLGVEQVDVDEV
jgi:hypothetical protein